MKIVAHNSSKKIEAMSMTKLRYACPVCGYLTLESLRDWDICAICFWEDDVSIEERPDVHSPANAMALSEAQANFIVFGVCKPDYIGKVRPPDQRDERDAHWKPLAKALEIVSRSTRPQIR